MICNSLTKQIFGKCFRGIFATRCYSQDTIKMVSNSYGNGSATEAPPLIIMHGLFGSKQNWRGISRALKHKLNPKRKIYAVDARNHGDSPHSPEHSYKSLSNDVVKFLRDEGVEKAALMGHSMGGRTMMHFALENPDLVDRAIIVDISPIDMPRDFGRMESIFKAMLNISVPPDTSMPQGRVIVERQIKEAVDGDQATVDFIMLNLQKSSTGEFVWGPNVEALHRNFRNFSEFGNDFQGKTFDGPVMFIAGTQSNFVNPDDWPAIQKLFPNGEIHWLDAGHLVHFDQPADFLKLVIQFLGR